MYEGFKGKRCFITGATGGLGRSLARKMAAHGCDLFLTSRHASGLQDLAEELRAEQGEGRKTFFGQADLNCVEEVNAVGQMAMENLSSIDILVNCAGVFAAKPLSEATLEDLNTSMNVNLRAAFILCKAFAPDMIRNKWGRIINIASTSACEGFRDSSLYCASKHALLGFSRALRVELGDHNIRVLAILPGAMKTAMGKLVMNQDYSTFLNPDDVADCTVYLSSHDSEMVAEETVLRRMVKR